MRLKTTFGIAFVVIAAGCTEPAGVGEPGRVAVVNNAFRPTSVNPAEDGMVTWTWSAGSDYHNITWADLAPGSGDLVSGTYTRDFSADTAGTYAYECTLHAQFGMTGRVIVR